MPPRPSSRSTEYWPLSAARTFSSSVEEDTRGKYTRGERARATWELLPLSVAS